MILVSRHGVEGGVELPGIDLVKSMMMADSFASIQESPA
jgi:hypothetical protein